MAKILFNETLIVAENDVNCSTGVVLGVKVYPDSGRNTVIVRKSNTLGQHDFYSLSSNSSSINNIIKTLGEVAIIEFDYNGEVGDFIELSFNVFISENRLNIFKAEINPGNDVIDYVTVDCMTASAVPLSPTPTGTTTPTPSTPLENVHKLFEKLYIYDAANITDTALDIGEILHKNNVLDEYTFNELNDSFGDSDVLYVREEKENVIYKIVKSGDSAIVEDFILAPSPTPTPTFTSTPQPTPTNTPTNTITNTITASVTASQTATVTCTPTLTMSSTSPLQAEDYYISHLSKAVCELPPIADDVVPYHETKKFRVDRFTNNNEPVSNEFLMDCQRSNSFIIDVSNLTIGNRYSFNFSLPHKSANGLAVLQPSTETFIAKDTSHNINIVATYGPESGKFLVKFTITDHTAEISEDEFFIFECLRPIREEAVSIDSLTDNEGNMIVQNEAGDTQTIIRLSQKFAGDNVVSLEGQTGEKIIVPAGYDYVMFIRDGEVVEERSVVPGEVLEFQSSILMGQGARFDLTTLGLIPNSDKLEYDFLYLNQSQTNGTGWKYKGSLLNVTGSLRMDYPNPLSPNDYEYNILKNIRHNTTTIYESNDLPTGLTSGLSECLNSNYIGRTGQKGDAVNYDNYSNIFVCSDKHTPFDNDKIELINPQGVPIIIYGGKDGTILTNYSNVDLPLYIEQEVWRLGFNVPKQGRSMYSIEPEFKSFCSIRVRTITADLYANIDPETGDVGNVSVGSGFKEKKYTMYINEQSWSNNLTLSVGASSSPQLGNFVIGGNSYNVKISNYHQHYLSWSTMDFELAGATLSIDPYFTANPPSSQHNITYRIPEINRSSSSIAYNQLFAITEAGLAVDAGILVVNWSIPPYSNQINTGNT